jgi:predicted transcriptional regulator
MGGRRTSKEELAQLEAYTKEGLTAREIAEKLGRSPAAIRNLRYKKHLAAGMKDEVKVLFQQRDTLSDTVKNLQGQKSTLLHEVDDLVKEKEKLLQNGPDHKELEFLCHKYGDVTEGIAIKRAVHNSYLEAFHGPFAEMMKNLENLKFGSNAP